MYSVLAFSMKYMFLNSVLCMASLLLNMYKTALVNFHLQLGLELFPFDIISNVAVCAAGQIPGIELLNFFDQQYQMLPISYHDKDIAFFITKSYSLLLTCNASFTFPSIVFNFEGGKRDIGK